MSSAHAEVLGMIPVDDREDLEEWAARVAATAPPMSEEARAIVVGAFREGMRAALKGRSPV